MNPFTLSQQSSPFSSAAIASIASSTKRWPFIATRLRRISRLRDASSSCPRRCRPPVRQCHPSARTEPLLRSVSAGKRVAQDLRFALRQLRHNPGFAVTAIFILALGMGVSVAIFAFVDAALIQPLPYFAPNRLVDVAENRAISPRTNLSRADYEDWKRLNHSFSSLDVYAGNGYLLSTPSGPEPVPAARVTDGFFRTLGVKPMLGRDFRPGEDPPGGAKIAILTYGNWQKRFGSRARCCWTVDDSRWRRLHRSSEFCHANLHLLRAPMRSSTSPCSTRTDANNVAAAITSSGSAGCATESPRRQRLKK